ncbi:MAG TPA: hypothetical protein VGO40_22545 [Longimicrobium sp.]|jgi:hypothetical protein|nr:hypothetical protein [Longimicrobium sp.]
MYQDILRDLSPVVLSTSWGQEAIRLLETEHFDLLSLDINLEHDHPRDANNRPNPAVPGMDGTDVLEFAAERKACNSVVVITSILSNESAGFVIRDVERRRRVLMTPVEYLNRLFPDRAKVLHKRPGVSVAESIQQFREVLTSSVLRQMMRSDENEPRVPPPYTLDYDNRETPARITIRSRTRRTASVDVDRVDYRLFFTALIESRRERFPLSDAHLANTFRDVQVAVDGLRRELRNKGIEDVDRLFKRVRKAGGRSGGWQLAEDVKLDNAASVRKWGRDPDTLGSDDEDDEDDE